MQEDIKNLKNYIYFLETLKEIVIEGAKPLDILYMIDNAKIFTLKEKMDIIIDFIKDSVPFMKYRKKFPQIPFGPIVQDPKLEFNPSGMVYKLDYHIKLFKKRLQHLKKR